MSNEIIQWLVGQAGLGGFAGFALVMLQRAYQQQITREKEISEERKSDRDALLNVVKSNTEAITQLTTMVERTNELSEGCELAQLARIKEHQKN